MKRLRLATLASIALSVLMAFAVTANGDDNVGHAAARDDRPNIVVIMTDDQFMDTVWAMPFVNARDDWARFSNATVNTALCCPSRATFLTGQTSPHHGIESNSETSLFKGRSTVADWLDDAGYQTGFVGKYMNKFPWDEADNYIPEGWDYWAGYTGSMTYTNFTLNENGNVVAYSGGANNSTDVLSDQAVDYIDQVRKRKPFFAFISYLGPHGPAIPPSRYVDADVAPIPETEAFLEADVSDKPRWVRKSTTPSVEKLRDRRMRHQRTLLAVDDGVEKIFDALERRGELDNTIVLYTTDHGISLGEHGYTKKTCGYEVCSNVPLLVRGPGVVPGGDHSLVGNIDFAPTLTDYAGIPTGRKVDGRSLRPLLEGRKQTIHKGILLARAQGERDKIFFGLRTKKWKYIRYLRTGELELYNLRKDPLELFNLMSTGRAKWENKAEVLDRRMETIRATRPKIRDASAHSK
jgi:arylsulfatase A-like enzyme